MLVLLLVLSTANNRRCLMLVLLLMLSAANNSLCLMRVLLLMLSAANNSLRLCLFCCLVLSTANNSVFLCLFCCWFCQLPTIVCSYACVVVDLPLPNVGVLYWMQQHGTWRVRPGLAHVSIFDEVFLSKLFDLPTMADKHVIGQRCVCVCACVRVCCMWSFKKLWSNFSSYTCIILESLTMS